jgi:hypothetical protein
MMARVLFWVCKFRSAVPNGARLDIPRGFDFLPAVLCLLNVSVGTGAAGDPKNRKRFGANGACGTGSI